MNAGDDPTTGHRAFIRHTAPVAILPGSTGGRRECTVGRSRRTDRSAPLFRATERLVLPSQSDAKPARPVRYTFQKIKTTLNFYALIIGGEILSVSSRRILFIASANLPSLERRLA
jgi:hypothetical protein